MTPPSLQLEDDLEFQDEESLLAAADYNPTIRRNLEERDHLKRKCQALQEQNVELMADLSMCTDKVGLVSELRRVGSVGLPDRLS